MERSHQDHHRLTLTILPVEDKEGKRKQLKQHGPKQLQRYRRTGAEVTQVQQADNRPEKQPDHEQLSNRRDQSGYRKITMLSQMGQLPELLKHFVKLPLYRLQRYHFRPLARLGQ